MATEKAFDDHRLVDVVALLGSRKASGRLRISDGTMRGAFFFNEGKLVSAHLGPFGGFQAVNLAISVDRPQLSFDPTIQPPSQSNLKIERERVLLKERYSIETWKAEPERRPAPTSDQLPMIPVVTRDTPVVELRTPATTVKPVASESDLAVNSTSSTLEGIGTNNNRSQLKLNFVPRNLLSYASRRQMFTLLVGLMVIATVSTTAGIASYWRKSPEMRHPTETARGNTTSTLQPAPTAPLQSQADEELAASSLKTEESSPATQVSPATSVPLPVRTETKTLAQSAESPTIETAAVSSTPEIQSGETGAKPSTLTIPVVVEITDGHVTEAFIQRPQTGFRAHEATALLLARQRRFPKGTNGKQTITLVVSPEP